MSLATIARYCDSWCRYFKSIFELLVVSISKWSRKLKIALFFHFLLFFELFLLFLANYYFKRRFRRREMEKKIFFFNWNLISKLSYSECNLKVFNKKKNLDLKTCIFLAPHEMNNLGQLFTKNASNISRYNKNNKH